MVKPAKLYERLIAGSAGTISFRDFAKLLEAFGFEHRRTSGSHRIYRHRVVPARLVIQPKGGDANSYQVDQFLALVQKYQLQSDA
ncbi:MAG: type II toxin-antitoxin system HicA family toxin [Parasphingopyxis sp.]|nr:type II toxin-antitoxin system HicA family toxin [Sphingomonadales bacterium]